MIYIRIQGGLGNQLNTYAVGRACAKHLGVELVLDIDDYRNRKFEAGKGGYIHQYYLDKLRVYERVATWDELEASDTPALVDPNPVQYAPGLNEALSKSYVPGLHIESLGGTWRHHDTVIHELREQLSPLAELYGRNAELYDEVRSCESVGVHIRLGDYVTNRNCLVLPPAYYMDCMEMVLREVQSPKVYVFTDSPGMVENRLNWDVPFTLVDWNGADGAVADLMLMSACRHKVIANSSFSFWAARLDGREGSLVLAPNRYMLPGGGWYKNERIEDQGEPDWPPTYRKVPVRFPPGWIEMLEGRK